jgi:hypothetical protein
MRAFEPTDFSAVQTHCAAKTAVQLNVFCNLLVAPGTVSRPRGKDEKPHKQRGCAEQCACGMLA